MSETIFEAPLNVAIQLAHNVAPPTKIIELTVDLANGFVLAQGIISKSDLPPFNASKVDGYAVSGPGPWKLVGENLAGAISDLELHSGTCIYVGTGAALPDKTLAVLKQEDCQVLDAIVRQVNGSISDFENIRPIGIEAKNGELVIPSGTKLTPALLGLIAACGYNQVSVYQKPKVDVLIFGDELIQNGISGSGKIRDSIGPQMLGWLDHFGGQLNEIKYVADQLDQHILAINESNADLIITTGGTASGPADHLHKAIAECGGSLLIDAVLVRPGYHQLIAELPNKFLIGLPGNPQSAVIGFITLVSNFIAGSTSRALNASQTRILSIDINANSNEHRMLLAREIQSSNNAGQIEPVEFIDSSMLRGFIDGTGFAMIEPGGMKTGSIVTWIPLP